MNPRSWKSRPKPWSPRLRSHPDPAKWDDWVEFESKGWPRKVERHYAIVPSLCFNCEAACGVLAYVDKETWTVRKVEGNPLHPGSRGRLCAKGAATVNQVTDPDRILHPLRREGPRGGGKWRRISWDEALEEIAGRMRRAIAGGRRNEIMYHIGRPGEDGHVMRVLQAWGVDGHNSHTNVCSSSARLGHFLWCGYDRPSPDYANAKTILLLSSHLETGHYFNPHAQRIVDAKYSGAKLIVVDPRLSNTAAKADLWLPARPGTEGALLLAIASHLVREGRFDAEFVRRWVNWEEYLREERKDPSPTFERVLAAFAELYGRFTFEMAEKETGVPAARIAQAAEWIAEAGNRFSTHVWRAASSGNLWGWQIVRCLYLLVVLTGSLGTEGGVNPHTWNKFVPKHPNPAPPVREWNDLLFPREFPLAFFEMSFLLPHLLKEGRGKVDVYFTRVYNPVWTNPDGMSWIEALTDEEKVGLHVCLTPYWSETAWFADLVLPLGMGLERHDNQSQETHHGRWIGFRQPVVRVAKGRSGIPVADSREANPGEVWEHNEFWIELSWRIDPDGSLGIRRYFESPYRPGEKIGIEEYYRWMFENGVAGLPEAAREKGMSPLEYMRRFGVFSVEEDVRLLHERAVAGAEVDPATGIARKDGTPVGLRQGEGVVEGFPTPSRRLEFWSRTMVEWGWPEHALPGYFPGHVDWRTLDREKNEFDLLPNFRLPTLIHTRSSSKWLYELANQNPVWIHPGDAERLGVETGELLRVSTRIGHLVNRCYVTEGIAPGVVAMSHHLGRWRGKEGGRGGPRWDSAEVSIEREGTVWRIRQTRGVEPFESADPDSRRIWWRESGVHQNLIFPVQPDPASGMHCWHQKVTVERARPGDRYGDVVVDTARSFEAYKEWMAKTRPAPGPGGLRRPLWFDRPNRPVPEAYRLM
ncbi:MAG TPA: molybdopterin-dependent oxidoreductase [Planctomycetota bacterium]|nr:molybdopterin-dependent oxidoreductase [Planctomycetota bacterium]